MKKKMALSLSAALLVSASMAMGVNAAETDAVSGATQVDAAPSVTELTLTSGTVNVYDYGELKLHEFVTGDALGDVAYIVEGADALVGIELPAFTDGLDSWRSYSESLGKPMDDIFVNSHVTGASYVEGMNVYATQGAADSISAGATFATTQGLYETFGDDFHGGSDLTEVNTIVSGDVTVGGIEFTLIDRGSDYDLEIPALNVVYTHMLGKTTHSILTSLDHIDAMYLTLKGYQDAGYDLILTSHGGIEGQDAVTEKIAYLGKTKELAQEETSYESFVAAMNEAFAGYDGANYLEMTAGFLYN